MEIQKKTRSNKNYLLVAISSLSLILLVFAAFTTVTFAQVDENRFIGIPCDGPDCTFNSFVQLVQNVLTFLVLLSLPIATIAFAWAGILMLTAAGNSGQVDHAKSIFGNVLKGLLFVLTAWLIVKFITTAILDPRYFTDLLG